MDPKRIESSSSISSGVEIEETKASQPVQEYGPFPGEVAYPPVSYYGNPFPTGHQPFPEIPAYPHVFDVPWGMVQQNVPYYTNNDYTKVNVDVDSVDREERNKSEQELGFDQDYRQFFFGAYPYGGYGYPGSYYGYGYGAPFMYPRPYVYPFII